jgi:hypothetical protein
MAYPNDEWQRKGATLSDKTAGQEFGLTRVNREIRRLRTELAELEERRAKLSRRTWPLLGCAPLGCSDVAEVPWPQAEEVR